MTWIDAAINKIVWLWPFKKVQPWQRAVRSCFIPFRGVKVTILHPGIARAIPWFDSFEVRDIREDTWNLPTQSVTTKDDVAVSLSANFVYEIDDVKSAVLNVQEFASSLQDLAMVHLAERIRELTWAELRDGQKDLERSLKGTLETRAKKWGVGINRVGITDLVKARQFRHFGELNTA